MSSLTRMSYSEFVAYTEQPNYPPGGISTVNVWLDAGFLDGGSRVLEIGSTTGATGRHIVKSVPTASLVGVDLSLRSCYVASRSAVIDGVEDQCRYIQADARRLPFGADLFTDVVVGATLGFIHRHDIVIDELARVMRKGGVLYAASLYYAHPPPSVLVDAMSKVLGARLSESRDESYWQRVFGRQFNLAVDIPLCYELPSDADLAIQADTAIRRDMDTNERAEALSRAYYERLLFREHATYLSLSVQIWMLRR